MIRIIERRKIEVNESQQKMIISGWGKDELEKSDVEKITYLSDGLKVKGYIAYPKDDSKKYPCIIWCRGGFGNKGAIDKFTARGMFGHIASLGYCVFTSQYRGNDGGEGHDDFGGDDLNDVLNLIPLADEIPQANRKVWGIEGWSRGGMMTYLTLTRTDIFKAAIIVGGISDLNGDSNSFTNRLYENKTSELDRKELREKCEIRSVINFPEKLSASTNLLLIHGTADETVSPQNSLDLSSKLFQLKRNFRLVLLERGDHFLKSYRKEVDEMRKNWFGKYLK
ncbi:MAG: prolyl oligopeptidase family serine peptidase [Ignavibacteriales bacterium]|nr:prolyl oligopeptidase family serine peptidase [Ignavibacteriales bacterium]